MGLLQKAVETYDSHLNYASQNREGQSRMAPVGHIVTRAELEITLDADGKFINARVVDKSEPKIIIPSTESSAGRTSAPCAHPLCDQIGYLIPQNEKKFRLYVDQLSDWEASAYTHPKLTAVLNYVKGETILPDLLRCGLVKVNAKGLPENEKMLVRWNILGDGINACWLDDSLFRAFTDYYTANHTGEMILCMVAGEEKTAADQHPKGIIPINARAKLLSANASSGFTYRRRFTEEKQAVAIGYEASQKAHNALRWLAQEQGVILGGRTFLCWNPQGRLIPQPSYPFMPPAPPIFRPTEYKDSLQKVLNSKKAELKLTDGVVLAVFDAATTGRLSLTYYNELQAHDFLERLHDWDASCCWPHRFDGIKPPTLLQIVNCAFGTQRDKWLETDDRVLRQQMQRLIACRVDKALIGADIVKALADRASRPMAYDHNIWENILFTACAVIRKYRTDRFKEEWNMALEPEKKDRSYQFGRLLAVMEKAERDTYDSGEDREPNALRLQSIFCQRPLTTAHNLEKQLEKAYFPRLLRKYPNMYIKYKNLMGQIMGIISEFPQEDWDKPLNATYLMGYYLQRSALYTKKTDNEMEENEQ